MGYLRTKLTNYLLKGLTCISPTLNTKLLYYRRFHKRLDLRNPQTSNEKVLWLKLHTYYKNALVSQCADKFLVREYVKQCGCEEILNELYASYHNVDDIVWEELPKKFVLKSSYFTGYNILVPDKSQLDISATKERMRYWQSSTDHLIASEMQYNSPHTILCEHFIESHDGGVPEDYKIYCCNGEPIYVMVCIGRQEGKHPKFYYFDQEGKLQRELSKDGLEAPADFSFAKPVGWNEMFNYARKLTKPFPFVRCDFYLSDGKVYFGELTFTPARGLDTQKLPYADLLLGSKIDLVTI